MLTCLGMQVLPLREYLLVDYLVEVALRANVWNPGFLARYWEGSEVSSQDVLGFDGDVSS